MGFPSPAADFAEDKLSLDRLCNTGAPGVFLFRSDTHSFREAIKPGAKLIVNLGAQSVDGSLVLCVVESEFRLQRLPLCPNPHLEGLDNPESKLPLPRSDEEATKIRGVATPIVNYARTSEFDDMPVI